MFVFDKRVRNCFRMGLISIYIFIIVIIWILVCFAVSQITNCFFFIVLTHIFPFVRKKILNMFRVSFGSLAGKVIKYRFVAPREGCYQDGCVSLIKYGPTCHYGK